MKCIVSEGMVQAKRGHFHCFFTSKKELRIVAIISWLQFSLNIFLLLSSHWQTPNTVHLINKISMQTLHRSCILHDQSQMFAVHHHHLHQKKNHDSLSNPSQWMNFHQYKLLAIKLILHQTKASFDGFACASIWRISNESIHILPIRICAKCVSIRRLIAKSGQSVEIVHLNESVKVQRSDN